MRDAAEDFLQTLLEDMSNHPDDYTGLQPRTVIFRIKEFVSDSGYMDMPNFRDNILKYVRYYLLGEELDV